MFKRTSQPGSVARLLLQRAARLRGDRVGSSDRATAGAHLDGVGIFAQVRVSEKVMNILNLLLDIINHP